MAIQINQPAPDFSLYDSDKNKVDLLSYRGKNVVLLFFPFAFSSVCTAELCNTRDDLSVYNENDAEVIAISVDSLYTLNRFKSDQQLNFTLLSDFNKEVSKAYDVLYEEFPAFQLKGVSMRAAFVIDKQGMTRYAEVCASPGDQPNFKAIQSILAGLQS